MDCKTARLLLEYARPHSSELDATETRALEAHLTACADCEPLARAERRADEVIGKAMRQVDVPDQLRSRILSRLNERQGEHRRRRIALNLRYVAAAAAVLLVALGLWRWHTAPPAFPVEQLVKHSKDWAISPPDRLEVETAFKSQGVAITVPDYNYNYFTWMVLANVEGRQTPLLQFNNRAASQQALVYIVSDSQFNLNALPAKPERGDGYGYKCDIEYSEGRRYGYVIYYTGDDYDWLHPVREAPDRANGN
jgi:hypothetical protein